MSNRLRLDAWLYRLPSRPGRGWRLVRPWLVGDRRVAFCTALALIILILTVASPLTGNWLASSAGSTPIFVLYNLILGIGVVASCWMLPIGCLGWPLGDLFDPRRFLDRIADEDEVFEKALDAARGSKSSAAEVGVVPGRKPIKLSEPAVWEDAGEALGRHRARSLGRLVVLLSALCIFLGTLAFFAAHHFPDGAAFLPLGSHSGPLDCLYYVVITLATIGNSAGAANSYGEVFVILLAALTIYIVAVALGAVVGQWQVDSQRMSESLREEF